MRLDTGGKNHVQILLTQSQPLYTNYSDTLHNILQLNKIIN